MAQYKLGIQWIQYQLKLKEQHMAKKKQPEVIVHNFVAKHMHEVNKSQVFVDRKKNAKRGYSKHKKGGYSNDYLLFLYAA